MVKQEIFTFEGRSLTKTWSDTGMLIRNIETGDMYSEAVDPTECGRQYEETNIPIEQDDISDTEALRIITGSDADEQA